MPTTKFTQPLRFPSDPDLGADSGATLGQVEEIVAVATEPEVDPVIMFENALL